MNLHRLERDGQNRCYDHKPSIARGVWGHAAPENVYIKPSEIARNTSKTAHIKKFILMDTTEDFLVTTVCK